MSKPAEESEVDRYLASLSEDEREALKHAWATQCYGEPIELEGKLREPEPRKRPEHPVPSPLEGL